MQFDSLHQIRRKAVETVRRFPLPLLTAGIAAGTLLWMIDASSNEHFFKTLVKVVLTCSLALPAFIGLALFCERYFIKWASVLFLNAVVIFLSFVYFNWLITDFNQITITGYFLLLLAGHLGVSFAPFLVNLEIQGFWQYNKALFLRFLTAALYAAVLFGGLSLALLAIDKLFAVSIQVEAYQRLFVVIATVFNTWFFLSGVPSDVSNLDEVEDYPVGLRIFTQFVLLPLVTVYLLILYVYGLKILITNNWPEGWVAYLVIGFSTAGILALLLVWPLRKLEHFKWIKIFTRYFFMALFPLVVLLFFSIYLRVKEYGVTENRYFIIVLAVWLLLNAVYFLFSEVKNIKVIPMTLFAFSLLSGFGPWSAFDMSRMNQRNRLIDLLKNQNMFRENQVVPATRNNKIPKEVRIEIGGVLDYLISTHGTKSVQDLIPVSLDSLMKKQGNVWVVPVLMKSWNLDYEPGWDSNKDGDGDFHYTNESSGKPVNVEGYQLFFNYEYYRSDSEKKIVIDEARYIIIKFNSNSKSLTFNDQDGLEVQLYLSPLVLEYYKTFELLTASVSDSSMTKTIQNSKLEYKVIFRTLQGTLNKEKTLPQISSIRADVLVRSR